MKFKIKVKNCYTNWEEEYTENISENEIDAFGMDLIANYNRTLRPGENPREYLGYIVVDQEYKNHEWEKQNLATIIGKGRNYDIYKCKICGVTGKRYGLSGSVLRDYKYRAKKYQSCNWKTDKE